ncbi:hypothetical protein MKX01_035938 [Papaver californicum]|nr:hypothetical protein MKX01_035938 [Papaver californicum]
MEEDHSKFSAAIVATELAASTFSVEMLSFIRNSLVSDDGTVNQQNHPPTIEFSSAKRIKLENATPSNKQSQQPASDPLPSCPQPESLQHDAAVTSEQSMQQQKQQQQKPSSPDQTLSLLSSPLALPPIPLPQSQFMQSSAASMTNSYKLSIPQQPHALSLMIGYAGAGMPSDQSSKFCQEFPGSEGGFYNQSSVPASSAISQQ